MKRYALILALVMALAAGFGCAKRFTTAAGAASFPLLKKEENRYAEGTAYFCGGG